MKYLSHPFPLIVAATLLSFSGCSAPPAVPPPPQVRLAGSVLSTRQNILQGNNVGIDRFTLRDVIRYDAYFTWNDVTKTAGPHQIEWNWYREGVLVSSGRKVSDFRQAPHDLWTDRAAVSLGTGKFRIDVVIDGKVLSSVNFEIR